MLFAEKTYVQTIFFKLYNNLAGLSSVSEKLERHEQVLRTPRQTIFLGWITIDKCRVASLRLRENATLRLLFVSCSLCCRLLSIQILTTC
jgi:hypothetical protein